MYQSLYFIFYIAIVYLPLVFAIITPNHAIMPILSAINPHLLFNSLALSITSAGIAILLSLLCSFYLFIQHSRWLAGIFFLAICFPPYVFEFTIKLGWRYYLYLPDLIPATIAEFCVWFPWCLLILYLAINNIDRRLLEPAIIYSDTPLRAWHRIIWPIIRPLSLVVFLIVALSIMSDFSLANGFTFRTHALALFSDFNQYHDTWRLLILSCPQVLLAAFCSIIIGKSWHYLQANTPAEFLCNTNVLTSWKNHHLQRFSSVITTILLIIVVISPIAFLCSNFSSSTINGETTFSLIAHSLALALFTAVIISAAATILAAKIFRMSSAKLAIAVSALLFPYLLPSIVIAGGWLNFFAISNISISNVAFMLTNFSRLGGLITVVIILICRNQHSGWWEYANLLPVSRWQKISYIYWPLMQQSFIVGTIIAAILLFNDITVYVTTASPNTPALTVKIYNLLHYGSSTQVATLTSIGVIAWLIAILALFLWQK